MRIVTNKELSTFKILPFDLYNESKYKILTAGEVLTPAKLIMLKNYTKIFTEEFSNEALEETIKSKSPANQEKLKKLMNFNYETLDALDFETVVNKDCVVKMEEQIRIKYYFKKVQDLFVQDFFSEGVEKLYSLIRVITADIYKQINRSQKSSKMRFMGEYEICHPLNVAVISGLIAKNLEYSAQEIEQIILAGLLHDIGKYKIKLNGKSAILTLNEEEVAEHTLIGYNLLKDILGLPEKVARVALEHHENNDGTGYPNGISSDNIDEVSQIINIANYYDNLANNRTINHIQCSRDALRTILEIGTKKFSAKILYTFVNMFNYDDCTDFNDMVV